MHRAVIDLGTNTFNLLIADTQTRQVLFQTKEGVALGMGGINEQRIGEAAMQRAFDTLCKFKAHCEQWKVQEIRAIGTSALRDAKNAPDFLPPHIKFCFSVPDINQSIHPNSKKIK